MSVDWGRFCEVIAGHQRFLLTSHIRPDCDALGSELGMAYILETLGKEVCIVNGQNTPPNLQFIDPHERIQVFGKDVSFEDLEDIEVIMVLDTSAWAQLGPVGDLLRNTKAKKIIVDHHVSEDDLGAELFKNVSAEATGRLVIEAAEHLGVPLSDEMAMPVFAAIATDTGWFRFASVDSGTYRAAGKLVDAGARPSDIYQELYERDTLGRVRLRGLALSRIEVELDGRLAHTYVRAEDFKSTGALPSDTEDLVNLALAIDDMQTALIIIELVTGGFKASFRSRCAVNCNEVAQTFGGGGHHAAAGAFIEAPFEAVREKVVGAMRDRVLALDAK